MIQIAGTPYYVDGAKSVEDEALRALNEAQMRPITDFVRIVAERSDDALRGDAAAGRCAMEALSGWASAGAMTGASTSRQGDTERLLDLAAISLAHVKARAHATPAQERSSAAWIAKLASMTATAFDDPARGRNNLHAWWSFGQMAAAAATRDMATWSRGRQGLREALSRVGPDGTLPMESARGEKAGAYHDYALQPLAAASALASWANDPLDEGEHAALMRLARHVSALAIPRTAQAWRPYLDGFSAGPRHFSPRLGGDTALMARRPPKVGG